VRPEHEQEFRRLFAEEARGRLESLAAGALSLEAGTASRETLDAMFRDVHTIKGGAAVVGLEEVAQRVHELEQLFDELRSRRRTLDQGVIDDVLAEVDVLRTLIVGSDLLPAAPAAAPAVPVAPETIPVPVTRLDELVRLVGESTAAQLRMGRLIEERFGADPVAADEYHRLARVLGDLQERTMRARMVSVATIAAPLQRTVRDVARARGRQVRWELVGGDTELDRHVLEALRDPLIALVRNAVDHGIEQPDVRRAQGKQPEGLVRVQALQLGADIVIAVSDDGQGVDLERVRAVAGRPGDSDGDLLAALFEPGVTTATEVTTVSGRGVGLDAVREAVDGMRGRVEVHTAVGAGTEFRITVPMTLAVLRCLVAEVGERRFALPLHSAGVVVQADAAALVEAEGRPALWIGSDAVPLADLGPLLGLAAPGPRGPAVVVSTPRGRFALRVDGLRAQRDVVVHELGRVLPRLPLVGGASVEPDGTLMLVLDPSGLVDAARSHAGDPVPIEPVRARRVLVVDDALTIRELQRSILARAGYEVVTAANGEEALARLGGEAFDLVLTDIEMPGLDGIALTRAIRADTRLAGLAVCILSARDSAADRRHGLDAGADAYLVKSSFDEHALLTAVRRLLGEVDRTSA
jgi:two-component system chemotaxis sensor kinase CheA